jgi:GxxExxY protein
LDYQKIVYRRNPSIQVKYHDKLIRTCTAKVLCIADQILCGVTAIQNQITLFDVARMRTYLRHSNTPIGLLVNFGKSNLEIKALYH